MTQPSHEQAVFDALPGTIPQIVKRTGVCRATVYQWIGRFRKQSKVRIKGWRRTAGQSTAYYVVGQGEDAPRPPAQTNAAYHRRHYVKHRRADDMEQRAIRKAARANASAMAKVPNTWLSALGVM